MTLRKTLLLALLSGALLLPSQDNAYAGKRKGSGRAHSSGHYSKGKGSSHKGGHYKNSSTGNHYRKRR